MADISVTLVLDDSQYTGKLKAAGTQATATGEQIKTSMNTATASFDQVVKSVEDLTKKLSENTAALTEHAKNIDLVKTKTRELESGTGDLVKKFEGLGAAIVGASLTSFITSAISGAAATERIAAATGITTAKFLELSAGAVAAGKDQDSLGRAMLRMEATAQQANDGSGRLKSAYHELGISMDDLHKLSPDQAFLRIAQALATMEDPGKKAELTMMTLGRDAKTIDWKSFVAGAEGASGSMAQHAESTADAARAYRSFQAGIAELKRNILDIIDPLLKIIGDNAHGFLGAKTTAEAFIAVLGTLVAGGIITGIKSLVAIVSTLGGVFGFNSAATSKSAQAMAAYIVELNAATIAQVQAATTSEFLSGAIARVGRATTAVAVAEAELTAAMSVGAVEEGTLAGLTTTLDAARVNLTVQTQALAITEAELAVIQGRVAVSAGVTAAATTGAAAATGGLSAAFIGLRAVLASFASAIGGVLAFFGAPEIAALAIIIATITIAWKAFGQELMDVAASAFKSTLNGLSDIVSWLDKITTRAADATRALFGMNSIAERDATRASESARDQEAGRGRGSRGAGFEDNVTPLLTTESYSPELARTAALTNRLQLMQTENALARARLELEIGLVGSTDEVRKAGLATFDENKKSALEILRIQGQIRVLTLENANPMDLGGKSSEIAALNKELGIIQSQVGVTGELTAELVKQQNTIKLSAEYRKKDKDLQDQVKKLQEETSQVGMPAEKGVAAIEKMRSAALEAIEEQKKLFGVKDVNIFSEQIKLLNKDYDSLTAAQRALNSAEISHKESTIFKAEDLKVGKELIAIQTQMAELTMTSNEKIIAGLNKRRDEETLALTKSLELARGRKATEQETSDLIAQQALRYQPLIDAEQMAIDKSKEFSTGWEAAYKQYAENANSSANQARGYFNAFTTSFESAIVKFVQTGKLSFKDLAATIIAEFAKIQAAKMAAIIAGGSSGLLGGIGSFLGIGGGAAAGAGATAGASDLMGSLAFMAADGGDVPQGKMGLVGERGPELFVPKSAGTIIPNEMLGGGNQQQAQAVTVNYNIQAVDASSFRSLVARDPQFIYAVTEAGRRSQPTQRLA